MDTRHTFRQIKPWLAALAIHAIMLVVVLAAWWCMINNAAPAAPVHVPLVDPAYVPPKLQLPVVRTWDRRAFGTEVTFFGVTRHARRIVFIIDASGSMAPYIDFVMSEVRRSVFRLTREQQPAVVFYQQQDLILPEVAGEGYCEIDPLVDWLRQDTSYVAAHGWADPRDAISFASSLKPELVVWITDHPLGHGRHEIDRDALLDHLWRKLTPGRVEICTICVGDDADAFLRAVARDNDGRFKYVHGLGMVD
ncbi:MAG: hypothetical protein GC159_21420 [Phycisphaera sp.]|nr:hypothetical protein [Phycisphaera sp.]